MMELIAQIIGTALIWFFLAGFGLTLMIYGLEGIGRHLKVYQEHQKFAGYLISRGEAQEFVDYCNGKERAKERH